MSQTGKKNTVVSLNTHHYIGEVSDGVETRMEMIGGDSTHLKTNTVDQNKAHTIKQRKCFHPGACGPRRLRPGALCAGSVLSAHGTLPALPGFQKLHCDKVTDGVRSTCCLLSTLTRLLEMVTYLSRVSVSTVSATCRIQASKGDELAALRP